MRPISIHERLGEMLPLREMADSTYLKNYQPVYSDELKLREAVAELESTEPITSPKQVDGYKSELSAIGNGISHASLIIIGECAESSQLHPPIDIMAGAAKGKIETVESSDIKNPLITLRGRGQNSKPRTAEYETLSDGSKVFSYMGDGINSTDPDKREPDPSRMVGAADQARDLEERLTELAGYHVSAAHEALLLPYEKSFIRTDPATGKKYLLSADLPWIGVKTNDPDGEHVQLLAEVENPTGIKIGPDSDAEHIRRLSEKLNPADEPGKLVFMPRLGLDEMGQLPEILRGIKEHAAGSLIVVDPMHGNTKKFEDGTKTRLVDDIIEEVKVVALTCKEMGLRLHGVHLETMSDNAKECIDEPGEQPTRKSKVDPQLNPTQTKKVLDAAIVYLN